MAHPAQLNLPPILRTHYQFLTDHPNSALKEYYSRPDVQARIETTYVNALKATAPKTAVGGGAIGLAVSWLSGFGVPGTIASVFGGAAGGAAVGVIYETAKVTVDIRLDGAYKAWKNSLEESVLNDFNAVLETHKPFEKFLCPITHDFPEIAVMDSFDRLYDQRAIYSWIDEKGTNPFTRQPIQPMKREDLTFYKDFAVHLGREMGAAFEDPEFSGITTSNSDEIIKGLKLALSSIITNHNRIILSKADKARANAVSAGLSLEEVDRIYQTNRAGFVDRPVLVTGEPKGLIAILTAESPQEFRSVIIKETPGVFRLISDRVANVR